MRSTFLSWGYRPIECGNCNTKHYVNFTTRLFISLCITMPILFNQFLGARLLNQFIDARYSSSVFLGIIILIYIFWIALVIGLTPFFARYHVEK